MQPDVVAQTLSHVEDEWRAQAALYTECDDSSPTPKASIVNCADAPTSFAKSCDTVVKAIVQGSGGAKDVTKEYMDDVCNQPAITGWHQAQCHTLSMAVRTQMNADNYENRNFFATDKVCTSFWSTLLEERKQQMAKETEERAAAEKKASEEAAEEEKASKEKVEKRVEQEQAEKAASQEKEAEAKAAEAKAEAAELAAKHEAEVEKSASQQNATSGADAAHEAHENVLANLTEAVGSSVPEAKANTTEAESSNETVVESKMTTQALPKALIGDVPKAAVLAAHMPAPAAQTPAEPATQAK